MDKADPMVEVEGGAALEGKAPPGRVDPPFQKMAMLRETFPRAELPVRGLFPGPEKILEILPPEIQVMVPYFQRTLGGYGIPEERGKSWSGPAPVSIVRDTAMLGKKGESQASPEEEEGSQGEAEGGKEGGVEEMSLAEEEFQGKEGKG